MLGMMIRTKKDPDERSTPNSLSTNFGKKDKKTNKLQLLAKVATIIAINGRLLSSLDKGICVIASDAGALSSI